MAKPRRAHKSVICRCQVYGGSIVVLQAPLSAVSEASEPDRKRERNVGSDGNRRRWRRYNRRLRSLRRRWRWSKGRRRGAPNVKGIRVIILGQRTSDVYLIVQAWGDLGTRRLPDVSRNGVGGAHVHIRGDERTAANSPFRRHVVLIHIYVRCIVTQHPFTVHRSPGNRDVGSNVVMRHIARTIIRRGRDIYGIEREVALHASIFFAIPDNQLRRLLQEPASHRRCSHRRFSR